VGSEWTSFRIDVAREDVERENIEVGFGISRKLFGSPVPLEVERQTESSMNLDGLVF
jgi:hypothetical protein